MEEKRREEWVAILRQSRLCRNLEEKELLNLMEQEGTVRTYSRGERIFQECDHRKRDIFRKKDPSGAAGKSRGSVRGGLCLYGESFL